MNRKTILLVEDADTLREVLAQILEEDGFDVVAVESVKKAREQFRHARFDCVLSDFKLPDENGIDLLRTIREIDRDTPFLIMTAYGTIEIAIEAMQLGANDFILKPFHPESLQEKLHQVIAHRQIVNRASGSRPKSQKRFATHNQRTQDVLTQAEKAARVDTTVLLLGESGTGKELIARAVHNWSPRSEKPFIAINCAAMPAELLESEFFGHEAGAFTGATQTRVGVLELASEGTLFLDEVGEMPPQLQVKLLRALQEREIKRVGGNKTIRINPRIVAATNVNIEDALREGRLREDFYYRLAVISLRIPPLRERPEDVLPLVDYYREFFTNRAGRDNIQLSEEAASLLCSYPWPGNVRELENVMERAVLLAGDIILPEHLGIQALIDFRTLQEAATTLPEIVAQATRRAEVELIEKALQQTSGNKTQAAKVLGVSYKTLLNKVRDYGLESERNTPERYLPMAKPSSSTTEQY